MRGGAWDRRDFMPTYIEETDDAAYVGPCRCGLGPRAYYRLRSGSIVHASRVGNIAQDVADSDSEMEMLTVENRRLEERIEELEKKLSERKAQD
jgi:hypothetical protein